MPTGLSLLTKAVEMANKTKEGLSEKDIISKCIIAMNFLLSKGTNIDHQDNSGRTALLTACHWQHLEIA
jgi:ankyrin repeat protein